MVLDLLSLNRGLSRNNRLHKRENEAIVEARFTRMYEEYRDGDIRQLAGRRGMWAPGGSNPAIGSVFPAVDMAYAALQRSLETKAGTTYEQVAREVGALSYEVTDRVPTDALSDQQQAGIMRVMAMLDEKWPVTGDPAELADRKETRHPMDYNAIFERQFLSKDERIVDGQFTADDGTHHLVQIKASGKLNKAGSRAEKLELLTVATGYLNHLQTTEHGEHRVDIHLCTALDGDTRNVSQWVRQYWDDDELMLGRHFWGFITQLEDGAEVVLRAIHRVAQDVGRRALSEIISEAFPPTLDVPDDEDPEIDELEV